MPDRLFLDLETYSTVPISAGTYAYARACEVMLCSYKFAGQPAVTWDATADHTMPIDLYNLLMHSDVRITAHNANFERQVFRFARGMDIPASRFDDTMILAYTAGLPGKMSMLCDALGLTADIAKLKTGGALVNLFCSPAPKNHKVRRYTRENRPAEWQQFIDYCERDTEVCEHLWSTLPHWTYETEYETWLLDQRINDRGIPLDRALCHAAIALVDEAVAELNLRLIELTSGAVSTVGQVAAIKDWLDARGCVMPSLGKDEIAKVIEADDEHIAHGEPGLAVDVREVLDIRLANGKSSVSKYIKALEAEIDGRVYGSLQHYGAFRTGRWAGRVIQPQNLFRPELKYETGALSTAINSVKNGTGALLYDNPVSIAASCCRAMISTL